MTQSSSYDHCCWWHLQGSSWSKLLSQEYQAMAFPFYLLGAGHWSLSSVSPLSLLFRPSPQAVYQVLSSLPPHVSSISPLFSLPQQMSQFMEFGAVNSPCRVTSLYKDGIKFKNLKEKHAATLRALPREGQGNQDRSQKNPNAGRERYNTREDSEPFRVT